MVKMLVSILGGIVAVTVLIFLAAMVLKPKGRIDPQKNLRSQSHGDADDLDSGEGEGGAGGSGDR